MRTTRGQPTGQPRAPGTSPPASLLAVSVMLGQPVSLREAAECFGVSRQAVHQAWRRMLGDQPMPIELVRAGHAVDVQRLAASGASVEDAMGQVGISRRRARTIARSAGVVLRSERSMLHDQVRLRVRRAVSLVEAGTTLGEACRVAVVRYDTLLRACRRMGVRASARGVRQGRGTSAADLVRGGMSVTEAAQQEGCAPQTVRQILRSDRVGAMTP